MIRALAALAAALLAPLAVHAQPVVSPGPDRVAVTIYRDMGREPDDEIELDELAGFALITETRTVTIPRGRGTIRFEGVAGGILPESAIVAGLPDGVREKNLDADLLSPRSLYARSYGRPVTIRREVGGRVIEEPAIIRSGPEGAAVLQTRDGFITADCRGDDQLVYESLPEGLSPKPTLSIETDSPSEQRATVTLSYLSWGFDWQANYVVTMRADGRGADLFAWVTLLSIDMTSFVDAEAMVIAGKVKRTDDAGGYLQSVEDREYASEGDSDLEFQCLSTRVESAPPPSPVSYVAGMVDPESMDAGEEAEGSIIVTASRIVRPEDLGDLKAYRIPDRTTVAANSQKQVALLDRKAVPFDVLYRARILDDYVEDEPRLMLRARNRKADGLGLALPAGSVALFEPRGGVPLLIGETHIEDKAVGEEVEIAFEESDQVSVDLDDGDAGGDWTDQLLTVTNANPFPVRFEMEFQIDGESYRLSRPSARLGRRNGRDTWATEVPANGRATLRYRLHELDN